MSTVNQLLRSYFLEALHGIGPLLDPLQQIQEIRAGKEFKGSEQEKCGVMFIRPVEPLKKLDIKKFYKIQRNSKDNDRVYPFTQKMVPLTVNGLTILRKGGAYGADAKGISYESVGKFVFLRASKDEFEATEPLEILTRYDELIRNAANGEVAEYVWNLDPEGGVNDWLTDKLNDPLKEIKIGGESIAGMCSPWFQTGNKMTLTPFHVEDRYCPSINYNHDGLKLWTVIYKEDWEKYERNLMTFMKQHGSSNPECELRRKNIFVPINVLSVWEIRFRLILQRPGDIVVTFPRAWHQVLNLTYTTCSSRNFIMPNFPEDLTMMREWTNWKPCRHKSKCWSAMESFQEDIEEASAKWNQMFPCTARTVYLGMGENEVNSTVQMMDTLEDVSNESTSGYSDIEDVSNESADDTDMSNAGERNAGHQTKKAGPAKRPNRSYKKALCYGCGQTFARSTVLRVHQRKSSTWNITKKQDCTYNAWIDHDKVCCSVCEVEVPEPEIDKHCKSLEHKRKLVKGQLVVQP